MAYDTENENVKDIIGKASLFRLHKLHQIQILTVYVLPYNKVHEISLCKKLKSAEI